MDAGVSSRLKFGPARHAVKNRIKTLSPPYAAGFSVIWCAPTLIRRDRPAVDNPTGDISMAKKNAAPTKSQVVSAVAAAAHLRKKKGGGAVGILPRPKEKRGK